MPKTPETDTTARKAALADAPLYDPGQHTSADGDPMVRVELACSCGAVRKQVDPVSYITRTVTDWNARHSGSGHGEASVADAIRERESRRESAYRAAGRPEAYEPSAPLEDASTEVRAWPKPSANTGSK
jgi:hypothetical protein